VASVIKGSGRLAVSDRIARPDVLCRHRERSEATQGRATVWYRALPWVASLRSQ